MEQIIPENLEKINQKIDADRATLNKRIDLLTDQLKLLKEDNLTQMRDQLQQLRRKQEDNMVFI